MTAAMAVVLRLFLNEPGKPRYGYDVMCATGIGSGKLYLILARLSKMEWLIRDREPSQPAHEGTSERCLYRINPSCAAAIRQRLAEPARQVQQRPVPATRGWLVPGTGQA